LGWFPDTTVPALARLFRGGDAWERQAAMRALGGFANRPEVADLALEGVLDPDPYVRWTAFHALSRVKPRPDAAAALPVLVKALECSDSQTIVSALQAIRGYGPGADSVIPAVLSVIDRWSGPSDGSPDSSSTPVPVTAVETLGALGPNAVSHLVALQEHRDERVRAAATEGLGRPVGRVDYGGPPEAGWLPGIAQALEEEDGRTWPEAVQALVTLAAVDGDALELLMTRYRRHPGSEKFRLRVLWVLGSTADTDQARFVDIVRDAAADSSEAVRERGLRCIARWDFSIEEKIRALVAALSDPSPRVRKGAADGLGRMGRSAAGGRTALERALNDPDPGVCADARRALHAIEGD
jgi:HEAT repeat protein